MHLPVARSSPHRRRVTGDRDEQRDRPGKPRHRAALRDRSPSEAPRTKPLDGGALRNGRARAPARGLGAAPSFSPAIAGRSSILRLGAAEREDREKKEKATDRMGLGFHRWTALGFCSPEIKGGPSDVIQRSGFVWTRLSPGGFRHWADFTPPAQVAAWLRAQSRAKTG
jgi:hypothetical protein